MIGKANNNFFKPMLKREVVRTAKKVALTLLKVNQRAIQIVILIFLCKEPRPKLCTETSIQEPESQSKRRSSNFWSRIRKLNNKWTEKQ